MSSFHDNSPLRVFQTVGRGVVVDARGEIRRGVVSEPVGPVQRPGEAVGRHEKRRETRRQDRRGAGLAVQTLRRVQ